MDFTLLDEQNDIQKAAREFAQGEFDPDLALELDQNGQFPESLWKKAAQLGFIGKWGMHLTEPHTTGCVTMMLEYGTGSI